MSIDPFRSRQVPDVAGRFEKERDRCRRQADLMWVGAMTAMFSDHELRLMNDLGFLSEHDLRLLRQAGRPVDARTLPARNDRTSPAKH